MFPPFLRRSVQSIFSIHLRLYLLIPQSLWISSFIQSPFNWWWLFPQNEIFTRRCWVTGRGLPQSTRKYVASCYQTITSSLYSPFPFSLLSPFPSTNHVSLNERRKPPLVLLHYRRVWLYPFIIYTTASSKLHHEEFIGSRSCSVRHHYRRSKIANSWYEVVEFYIPRRRRSGHWFRCCLRSNQRTILSFAMDEPKYRRMGGCLC